MPFEKKGLQTTELRDKGADALKKAGQTAKDVVIGAAHIARVATDELRGELTERAKRTVQGLREAISKGFMEEEEPLQFADYSGVDVERLNKERRERNARRGVGGSSIMIEPKERTAETESGPKLRIVAKGENDTSSQGHHAPDQRRDDARAA